MAGIVFFCQAEEMPLKHKHIRLMSLQVSAGV